MDAERLHMAVTIIQHQLAAAVAASVPESLERMPEAQSLTASTDADFLIALTAFECDPSPRTRARLRDSYVGALATWRLAASRYAPPGPAGSLRPGVAAREDDCAGSGGDPGSGGTI